MNDLVVSDRAPYLLLGPDVEIPDDVSVGAHVILYPGTRLGIGCRIEDGAIIGRKSRLSIGSNAREAIPQPTTLGPRTIVGAHAIVCAGVTTGPDAYIGDHALVREAALIGARASIGFSTSIGGGCRIGDRTRLQGFCGFPAHTIIEEDCVVGPYVVALASTFREGEERTDRPVRIGRASRIGSAVQLMPSVEIGAGAVIGAASVVTRDVPPGVHVRGTPARAVERG